MITKYIYLSAKVGLFVIFFVKKWNMIKNNSLQKDTLYTIVAQFRHYIYA
jgi:hypothetical protein